MKTSSSSRTWLHSREDRQCRTASSLALITEGAGPLTRQFTQIFNRAIFFFCLWFTHHLRKPSSCIHLIYSSIFKKIKKLYHTRKAGGSETEEIYEEPCLISTYRVASPMAKLWKALMFFLMSSSFPFGSHAYLVAWIIPLFSFQHFALQKFVPCPETFWRVHLHWER